MFNNSICRFATLVVLVTCLFVPEYSTADQPSALQSFSQRARLGHADAQYNLGLIYEEGMGVAIDLNQALYWYGLAAEKGYVRAQYKLGYLFYFGPQALYTPDTALQWFHRAADQNDPNAIYRLGIIHAQPGESQNIPLALSYLKDAARAGHSGAQQKLGQLLAEEGPQQNLLKAHIWLSIATERGGKDSLAQLSEIARQLDSRSLSLAKDAARAIYNSIYNSAPLNQYAFNNRNLDISLAMMTTTHWLSEQGISFKPDQIPAIKLLNKERMVEEALRIESRKGGFADEITLLASYSSYDKVPLRALYDGFTHTVLMPDDWDYNDVIGQAELIHELVHHHQVITGMADRIACNGTLEKQAMRMQNRYLETHDLPPVFSETDIVLMGDCDE